MKIIQLKYSDLKPYKSQVEKESVDLKESWTMYIWAEIQGKLAGFVWVMKVWNNLRYKSDYVFDDFRGKWVYDNLFKAREEITAKLDMDVTAFCTSKSIWTFLRYGFDIQSKNKNWFYFVKRSKWKNIKNGVQKKGGKA